MLLFKNNLYQKVVIISWFLLFIGLALLLARLGNPLDAPKLLVGYLGGMFVLYFCFIFALEKKFFTNSFFIFIIVTSVTVQAIFLFMPVFFNDFWRYLWDGKIIFQGVNPYKYSPWEVYDNLTLNHLSAVWYWDQMYFKWSHTIYPPTLQAVFALASAIKEDSAFVLKFMFLLFNLGSLGLGVKLLKILKKEPIQIAYLVLNPLFLFETMASTHSESVLIFFVLLTMVFFLQKKYILTAISYAFLVLTKFFPILILPLILKLLNNRQRFKFVIIFISIIILLYLPLMLNLEFNFLFKSLVVFSRDWLMSPGLFYLVQTIFDYFLPYQTALLFSKLLLAFGLVGLVIVLTCKFKQRTDLIISSYIIFTGLIIISSTIFSWYLLWLVCLLPFVKQKWPVMIFSASIIFQYWLIYFDIQDQIFKYFNNGVVGWNQLIIWLPFLLVLVWQFYRNLNKIILTKNKQKISIIIPTFNEEKFIVDTLRQFDHQAKDIEIIIVDAYSSDQTIKRAKHYLRSTNLMWSIISSDKGRAKQMNLGAKKAKNEILLFLHADTLLADNAIKFMIQQIANLDLVGGAFSIKYNKKHFFYPLINYYSNFRARVFKIFHGDQGVFIQSNIFQEIGGFDQVSLMEDHLLSLKMRKQGRAKLLSQQIYVSPRRIETNGVWKSIWLYFLIKGLFFMGVSTKKLDQIYNKKPA